MILAIDFDGTIVNTAGELISGAKENINKLKDKGHFIIMWTSRTGERLTEAENFLNENEIQFDAINENKPGIKNDPRKVVADVYIDDKNFGGLPEWEKVYDAIETRKKEVAMDKKKFTTGIIRSFDRAKAEETREVEFVISDETRDRHGTIIPLKNWDLNWFNQNGIVGYQHDVYGDSFMNKPDPDDVIGRGEAFIEDGKLIGRVSFEPAEINPKAEKIFQKVLNGTLKATSVGFIETKAGNWGEKAEARDGENPTYYFGDVQLLEFSIVNIPSNPAALRRTVDAMMNDLQQEETIENLKNKNQELETRNQVLTNQVETLKLNNRLLKMKRPHKVN